MNNDPLGRHLEDEARLALDLLRFGLRSGLRPLNLNPRLSHSLCDALVFGLRDGLIFSLRDSLYRE